MFSYKAFINIPKDERSKLDAKTIQCIFLGYGQDQFGYRFYDSIKKRLVGSCDAIFIEHETIKDIDKMEKYVSDFNNDSSDLKLIPPTLMPREVGDKDQVDLPDEDDAPIEVGSKGENDDIDRDDFLAPIHVASWGDTYSYICVESFTLYHSQYGRSR